ncbi:MAG: bifunctional methylenetetrahydrofolate dehydrogenase/methenyltetrahydrofolate cyclohydrolase, partial [Rhizobiales bacterium]|nr:bifunctional methylenetetrahydrofolate dehydrogenase/methenyltetrahydrofolate cyclohydrolase [Hyphomicrobiales bacterium]
MTTGPSSSARVIDGKAVAAMVTDRVGEETVRLKQETHLVPGLAVVLVGEDPASQVYVGAKARKAEELGFHSVQHTLPVTTGEDEL